MKTYPFDRGINNKDELLEYFLDAINYRNKHKELSKDIALHVFGRTNSNGMLSFEVPENIVKVRFEFGALEYPGWSDDVSKDLEESEDDAWQYVLGMVNNQIKNGTV